MRGVKCPFFDPKCKGTGRDDFSREGSEKNVGIIVFSWERGYNVSEESDIHVDAE